MSQPKQLDDTFRILFAPDAWTPLGKLKNFLGPPFQRTKELQSAIQSSVDRSRKFETLASLANRVQPLLLQDIEELESSGYTRACRSSEFAALLETLICELYGVLDSLRYTLYWAYREHRGVQKKSTSKLFSRAANREYSEAFPESIRILLASAYTDWFQELHRLRTELTHGGTGSCNMNKETNLVSYMHRGLGNESKALVIEDITGKVNSLAENVFSMARSIGEYMYQQLEPIESTQFCGMYKGRIYTRTATPEKNLSRQSGICAANTWFEKEINLQCPLTSNCTAYARKIAL